MTTYYLQNKQTFMKTRIYFNINKKRATNINSFKLYITFIAAIQIQIS